MVKQGIVLGHVISERRIKVDSQGWSGWEASTTDGYQIFEEFLGPCGIL
jgi:hypothetical protein